MQQPSAPAPPQPKVNRPLRAAVETYAIVFGNLSVIARLMLWPAVLIAGGYVADLNLDSGLLSFHGVRGIVLNWFALPPLALQFAGFTIFATAWHRRLLTISAPGAREPAVRWTRTEWYYLGASAVLLGIALSIPPLGLTALVLAIHSANGVFGLMLSALLAGGLAVALYLLGRVSLVLPALALREKAPLTATLRRVRGRSVTVLLTVAAALAPVLMIWWLQAFVFERFVEPAATGWVAYPPMESMPLPRPYLAWPSYALAFLTKCAAGVVAVTALSVLYRNLAQAESRDAPQP